MNCPPCVPIGSMVASSPSIDTYRLTRQMPPTPLTISSAPTSSTLVDSDRLDSQRFTRQTCATAPARPRKAMPMSFPTTPLAEPIAAARTSPPRYSDDFRLKSRAVTLSDGTGIAVTESCVLSVNA